MIKKFNKYFLNENSTEEHPVNLPYNPKYPYICIDEKDIQRYVCLIDFEKRLVNVIDENGLKLPNLSFDNITIKRFSLSYKNSDTNSDVYVYTKINY